MNVVCLDANGNLLFVSISNVAPAVNVVLLAIEDVVLCRDIIGGRTRRLLDVSLVVDAPSCLLPMYNSSMINDLGCRC